MPQRQFSLIKLPAQLSENAKKCHVEDKVKVLEATSCVRWHPCRTDFDYLFMDPPYDRGFINKVILALFTYQLVDENSMLVVEHNKRAY